VRRGAANETTSVTIFDRNHNMFVGAGFKPALHVVRADWDGPKIEVVCIF
jgi:hypothetical protein